MKVDKSGCGLLKVWKHQLLQFQHLGPDMAEAIIAAYPSPRMLIEVKHCVNSVDIRNKDIGETSGSCSIAFC